MCDHGSQPRTPSSALSRARRDRSPPSPGDRDRRLGPAESLASQADPRPPLLLRRCTPGRRPTYRTIALPSTSRRLALVQRADPPGRRRHVRRDRPVPSPTEAERRSTRCPGRDLSLRVSDRARTWPGGTAARGAVLAATGTRSGRLGRRRCWTTSPGSADSPCGTAQRWTQLLVRHPRRTAGASLASRGSARPGHSLPLLLDRRHPPVPISCHRAGMLGPHLPLRPLEGFLP